MEALRKLSAEVGANPLLVQGAGGNSSIKENGTLTVKSSGKWMSRAGDEEIFVRLDLAKVLRLLHDGAGEDLSSALLVGETLRPSIETTLHAVIPDTVVLHVHSISAISIAVHADGEKLFSNLLEGLPWAWIPYRRPGVPLTREIEKHFIAEPRVLIFQNHGLLVSGQSCSEVKALLEEVEGRIAQPCRPVAPADHETLDLLCREFQVRLPRYEESHALAIDKTNFAISMGGVLYPDSVVFLGPKPAILGSGKNRATVDQEYQSRYGMIPEAYFVPGTGVLLSDRAGAIVDEMLRAQVDVLSRISDPTKIRYLSTGEVGELLNWDAEKHRIALNS